MPSAHPGVGRLTTLLAGRAYTAGTCKVPPQGLFIYYRNPDAKQAGFIDVGNATREELEKLNKACQPATFGLNSEDVLDETYRKAGKIDTLNFATGFDLASYDIIHSVASELVEGATAEGKALRAELYKLNVYDTGSFFRAHQDTPRAPNMIGSLVLVFPTEHQGGALSLRHKGQEWTFDSGKQVASNNPSISYIAFYSDVEHEVTPVTSGHRITLTYNLYLEDVAASTAAVAEVTKTLDSPFKTALQELLADSSFLPSGGLLAFGLSHQYPLKTTQSSKPTNYKTRLAELPALLKVLKGSDATLYRVCQEFGLKAHIYAIYELDRWDEDDAGRPERWKVTALMEHIPNLASEGAIEEDMVDIFRDFKAQIIDPK